MVFSGCCTSARLLSSFSLVVTPDFFLHQLEASLFKVVISRPYAISAAFSRPDSLGKYPVSQRRGGCDLATRFQQRGKFTVTLYERLLFSAGVFIIKMRKPDPSPSNIFV